MSISDGLGTSIFCWKVENARPMREGMDMKIVFFPTRVVIFNFDAIIGMYFPYLYLNLACKQLCLPLGKGINRKNESTSLELFRAFSESCILNLRSVVLMILTSIRFLFPLLKTVNTILNFPFKKIQSIVYYWKHFSRRNGNSKTEGNYQP